MKIKIAIILVVALWITIVMIGYFLSTIQFDSTNKDVYHYTITIPPGNGRSPKTYIYDDFGNFYLEGHKYQET